MAEAVVHETTKQVQMSDVDVLKLKETLDHLNDSLGVLESLRNGLRHTAKDIFGDVIGDAFRDELRSFHYVMQRMYERIEAADEIIKQAEIDSKNVSS